MLVFDQRICERPPDGQDGGGQDSGGQGLGVEFTAVNLCGRPVKSVSFRASVAEKEEGGDGGDALGLAFYEASWTLEDGLDAGEERTVFIPLDGVDSELEADGLEIESVLVESAVLEDGGWWRRKN